MVYGQNGELSIKLTERLVSMARKKKLEFKMTLTADRSSISYLTEEPKMNYWRYTTFLLKVISI